MNDKETRQVEPIHERGRKQRGKQRSRRFSERLHDDWLGSTLIVIVLGMIAFAAAAYGAVQPWSEVPLVLSTTLLTGLAFAQVRRCPPSQHLLLPLGLLAAFALLVIFQLLPLPTGLVSLLSPKRVSTVTELLGTTPAWLTLSYYSSVTSHGLRLLLMGIAVFFAVAMSCTTQKSISRILLGVFAIGVAEALLALLQISTGGGSGIYWSGLMLGGVRSGSFVNHSNFSQFLNLTAGAGLGLLLIRFSQERHGQLSRYGRSGIERLFKRHWWLFAGLAIHAIAIVSSLSRGGILAMLVAGAIVVLMLGRRQSLDGRLWALVVLLPLVLGGLTWMGFDKFYDRLGTLEEPDAYADRWELGMATLRVARDHPLLGTGLETHAYVFPAYDTTGSVAEAEQADNDYAQLIEEVGLLGVAMVVLFLGVMARRINSCLSSSQDPVRYACYGVAYGLIAVGVQSLTDFGQRIPAVFFVSAVLCGVGVAITYSKENISAIGQESYSKSPRWLTPFLIIIAIPIGGWTIVESLRDFRADNWWAHAYALEKTIEKSKGRADLQDYIDRIATAEMAAKLRPDRVDYAFWLNAYRWQLLLRSSGGNRQSVIALPNGKKYSQEIANRLTEARRLCPTYGPAYTLEGQIRTLMGDAEGACLVRLGGQLTPNSPLALFAVAELEAAAKPSKERDDTVRQLLNRAVALDETRFRDACKIFIQSLKQPEASRELAGRNVLRLRELARILKQEGSHEKLVEELTVEASKIREEKVLRGKASAEDMAAVAAERVASGDLEEAILLFRQALVTKYNHIAWRLALSDTLVRLERYEEAFREARTCLRIRPNHAGARRRMEKISLLIPATGITFEIPASSETDPRSATTESEAIDADAIDIFKPSRSP